MRSYLVYNVCILSIALSLSYCSVASAEEVSDTNDETSFTDFIQQNAQTDISEVQNSKENKDDDNTTWISSIVSKVAEKGSQALSGSVEEKTVTKRSNASVFDIAGVMLRMDKEQVLDALQKRGYKKIYEHMDIPNFIRWRYEEQCRNQGIVGYERIASCVYTMSKNNNYQYVQQMKFSNFHTKESIEINYTSNFTGNKVYRILYETEAANIVGTGAKAEYLRNIKIFDFWKKINQKYGKPDNKEQIIWGLGEKKPSLRAKTGKLLLEDPMLLELDYTRMSREDKKFMNTAVYTF